MSWNSGATTNGSHTLAVEARDAAGNRRAASITVNVANGGSTLPSPWLVGNVGTVGTPASASYANGVFTLDAGGSELWAGSDSFGCVYRSWTGDGDLITRVATVTLPSGAVYASGGIMFRDGLTANAMHASIIIGTDGKLKFRRRKAVGGTTLSDGPSAGTTSIPRWLRLSRRGSTFSAFYSQDGASWTSIPAPDSTVALPSTVVVGVLALRNGGTATTRATFSSVSVAGAWTDADVGAVGGPAVRLLQTAPLRCEAAGRISGVPQTRFTSRTKHGAGTAPSLCDSPRWPTRPERPFLSEASCSGSPWRPAHVTPR